VEPLLETIELDREEANELLFKVKVEGLDQAPAKVRLVCEAGDVWYMFNGHATPDEGVVQFIIPPMKDKAITEEAVLSRVEVLIENRYFAPVQFQLRFKQAVKVVAEAIRIPEKKLVPKAQVTVSAPIVVNRKSQVPPAPVPAPVAESAKPVVVEAPVKVAQRPTVAPPATKPVEKKPFAPRVPGTPNPKPSTLKERYARKQPQVVEGEELIKELARTFVRGK
jgi:hypothetical protein